MLSNPKEQEKLDPRVKRTRSLILRAFEGLLAEKGFESISVQDVTDKAEINRATFYAHFRDKYELLDRFIGQMFMQEIEKTDAERLSLHPRQFEEPDPRGVRISRPSAQRLCPAAPAIRITGRGRHQEHSLRVVILLAQPIESENLL